MFLSATFPKSIMGFKTKPPSESQTNLIPFEHRPLHRYLSDHDPGEAFLAADPTSSEKRIQVLERMLDRLSPVLDSLSNSFDSQMPSGMERSKTV